VKNPPSLGRMPLGLHDLKSLNISIKNDPAVCTELSPYHIFLSFPRHGTTAPSGPGSPRYLGFAISLRHTLLVGLL
jgi:hypothetical protein